MYKVQKKDGSIENFEREKLKRGAINAGATEEEAEKIASEVEAWLPTVVNEEGVVQAVDIRTKGLEILRSLNPEAAARFESYQKPA